jgi:hypothetical protein
MTRAPRCRDTGTMWRSAHIESDQQTTATGGCASSKYAALALLGLVLFVGLARLPAINTECASFDTIMAQLWVFDRALVRPTCTRVWRRRTRLQKERDCPPPYDAWPEGLRPTASLRARFRQPTASDPTAIEPVTIEVSQCGKGLVAVPGAQGRVRRAVAPAAGLPRCRGTGDNVRAGREILCGPARGPAGSGGGGGGKDRGREVTIYKGPSKGESISVGACGTVVVVAAWLG